MSNNKKKGLIRRFQDFLVSYNGKVMLNYAYSWGASIVILGALFKLTHLPGANLMLWIGMGTEVLVFFVSAFDRPYKAYKWESVFPNIKISGSSDDTEKVDINQSEKDGAEIENKNVVDGLEEAIASINANRNIPAASHSAPLTQNVGVPTGAMGFGGTVVIGDMSTQKGENVSAGISAEVAANSPEIADATASYLAKLQTMADSLERFNSATNSLSEVSDTLLKSYKSISDNSDSITSNSEGYVEQMQSLNRNLMGLNTIYEIQLKSISSQIDTIDKVNIGLSRIKEMYEGSTGNSEKFNAEAEKMAQQIEELNNVYARMLKAMTVNMNNQQL